MLKGKREMTPGLKKVFLFAMGSHTYILLRNWTGLSEFYHTKTDPMSAPSILCPEYVYALYCEEFF